jgi:hypothetical protein
MHGHGYPAHHLAVQGQEGNVGLALCEVHSSWHAVEQPLVQGQA